MPWQLPHETPSAGSTPEPRPAESAPASGAWQTTQRGLAAGFGIESASAILAERAVVSVAYDLECTSRCDQTTYWSLRSPPPPWQPLLEHVFAPRAISSAARPLAGAEIQKMRIRPARIADRMIIGLARRKICSTNGSSGASIPASNASVRGSAWAIHSKIMLEKIVKLVVEHPASAAGALIVCGLALEVCILVATGASRLVAERRRASLQCRRLAFEIERARLQIKGAEEAKAAWNGLRKFSVTQKVMECADTFSFYLEPHDGKSLPTFKPGQYLTFQLNIPGLGKPVVRCYSLSDCARPKHYRVTIKRSPPPEGGTHPPGVGSSFFCDRVKVGDILDVKAPNGHFHLDLAQERPVVLISGGVGVTPMIAMANALSEARSNREIWFFHGARNGANH